VPFRIGIELFDLSVALANDAVALAVDNTTEPTGKSFRFAQLVYMLVRGEKGLLDGIFGQLPIC